MQYPQHIWNAYCFICAHYNWLIVLCICSSRSVISLHKCHYVYIFLPPFQENSTTCPATTSAPPPAPPYGLSTDGAIVIGVTLGLLGVVVAVAIIMVVVLVVIRKRCGVGKRSSWVNIYNGLCAQDVNLLIVPIHMVYPYAFLQWWERTFWHHTGGIQAN